MTQCCISLHSVISSYKAQKAQNTQYMSVSDIKIIDDYVPVSLLNSTQNVSFEFQLLSLTPERGLSQDNALLTAGSFLKTFSM